jgi:hypothetical protein
MWETYPDAGMAGWGGKDRTAIFPFAGRLHRNKIAHVLLDFCCDWSGAADAGSGDGCFSDPTPRAAGPGGVEVVRQMVSLTSEVRMSKSKAKPHPRSTPAKRRTSAPVPTASQLRRAATKHAQVLALLRGKRGATIRTLAKATGWQPHSVRGFLAGVVKKKLGLCLVSQKTEAGRVYRIGGMKPASNHPDAKAESSNA